MPDTEEPVKEAPRSQEPQPLEPKAEKKERPKKKKKEPKVIKKDPLYNYYITFRINVKGDKKDVAYLIKAKNSSVATETANVRAKREFSGLRSMTHLKVREATDTDEESLVDVIEDTKTSSKTVLEPSKENTKVENSDVQEFLEGLSKDIKNAKIWRVVYTPGRKPRKRDYDTNFLVVAADTYNHARERAKETIESMGISYKDKFVYITPDTIENVVNSKSFIDFMKRHKNDKDMIDRMEKIEPMNIRGSVPIPTLTTERDDKVGPQLKKKFHIKINEKGEVIYIEPMDLNVFEQPNYKKYIINPAEPTAAVSKPVTVLAPSPANAMMYFFLAYQNDERLRNQYTSNIISIGILDPDTGKFSSVDVKAITDKFILLDDM